MSFRPGRGDMGGNPNKMDLGEPRMFGMDGDKAMRDDPEDRFGKFDSNRGRRNPPFVGGRGRRPSPGRDRNMDRPREFFGRDEPGLMRDRSPIRGGPDADRFKKDDLSHRKREDMGRKEPNRPFYDEPHRDRFMGMEGRSRFESSFNSRFDGPDDSFKSRPFNYPNAPPSKGMYNEGFPKPNECEIIVVNKLQRLYAESVEARVKNLGILVDVLFLKDEALLTQTIDDIARRGSFYAMVISPQNESHHSVTVNILHGTPQEHRNMPLDDALKLVSRNFHEHIRVQKEKMERERAERGPYVGVVSADPEIQFLLRMLADGRWISTSETSAVIRYLTERRDKMQGVGGDRPSIPPSGIKRESPLKPKDDVDVIKKEQDLQNRIMNVMNQVSPPLGNVPPSGMRPSQAGMGPVPGMVPTQSSRPAQPSADDNHLGQERPSNEPAFSSASSLPSDPATSAAYNINFDSASVQKALDNLMQSGPNLLKNISLSGAQSSNTVAAKPAMDAPNLLANPGRHMGPPRGGIPDMGPPRGMDMEGMGPPRGMPDMGPRGNMPEFSRMGPPPRGPEGGRMGPQGDRSMGPPQIPGLGGRGPSPTGPNFSGRGQFGNYSGPQGGNFPGPYNSGPNMMGPRPNYGGNPGPMGGPPRRY